MARFADRLKEDVLALALPGGRMVGSSGHAKARRYLTGRMSELGLAPYKGDNYELTYRVNGEGFFNLVGAVPGERPSATPVLIGAHYDSVIDAPCADDNAAAVALALAAAESLRQRRRDRDVLIAIFDAEEPWHFQSPSMGSIRFYEDRLAEAVAVAPLRSHDGSPVDTTAFDIRHIQKACGLRLPLLLKLPGVKKLATREDIDTLADKLLGMGR